MSRSGTTEKMGAIPVLGPQVGRAEGARQKGRALLDQLPSTSPFLDPLLRPVARQSAVSATALVCLSLFCGASASSQGLYALAPVTGQLLLVNQTSGARSPIGAGLAGLGWVVPKDCTPTAVDTTGNWMYTFARRQGAAPTAPWSVLSLELRDGSIRKAYELPPPFPPSLSACEHGLAEDGAWHAYVAAVTRDAQPPRLLVWRFTYTWPASNESAPLVDVPLAALGMGTAPPGALSTTVTNFTWWISLANGLGGVDLVSLAPSRRLPVGAGQRIEGLQYDISGDPRATYGILVDVEGRSSVLSFVDSGGSGVPSVNLSPTAVPAVPDFANRVALINDHGAVALVSNNSLLTLSLDGGLLMRAPACGDGGCPVAIAYEPFVFARAAPLAAAPASGLYGMSTDIALLRVSDNGTALRVGPSLSGGGALVQTQGLCAVDAARAVLYTVLFDLARNASLLTGVSLASGLAVSSVALPLALITTPQVGVGIALAVKGPREVLVSGQNASGAHVFLSVDPETGSVAQFGALAADGLNNVGCAGQAAYVPATDEVLVQLGVIGRGFAVFAVSLATGAARHALESTAVNIISLDYDAVDGAVVGLGVNFSGPVLSRTISRVEPATLAISVTGSTAAETIESCGVSAFNPVTRALYWIGDLDGNDPFYLVQSGLDGRTISKGPLCASDPECPWSLGYYSSPTPA